MHTTTSSQTPDFEASSRGSDKILWFQTRSCSGDTSLCRQRAMITDVRSARNAAAPKSLNDVDRCVYVLNGDHHFVRMCTSISKFQITDSPSPCTQKFRRHHSENMSLHIVLNDLQHHKMYHHTARFHQTCTESRRKPRWYWNPVSKGQLPARVARAF